MDELLQEQPFSASPKPIPKPTTTTREIAAPTQSLIPAQQFTPSKLEQTSTPATQQPKMEQRPKIEQPLGTGPSDIEVIASKQAGLVASERSPLSSYATSPAASQAAPQIAFFIRNHPDRDSQLSQPPEDNEDSAPRPRLQHNNAPNVHLTDTHRLVAELTSIVRHALLKVLAYTSGLAHVAKLPAAHA